VTAAQPTTKQEAMGSKEARAGDDHDVAMEMGWLKGWSC